MTDFFSHLTELYKTPAVDLSNEMSNPSNIDEMRNGYETDNLSYEEKLSILLTEARTKQIFEKIGINKIVFSGVDKVTDGDTGKSYYILYKNGIPSVHELENERFYNSHKLDNKIKKENLLFDESDQQDYNNRFTSIDAAKHSHDSSDISFLRIVKASDTKFWKKNDQVFPKYNSYVAPGISKNKFRQFILLAMSEASQERMQIVETSEEYQLLFYGKRPEILQIQGILKNTIDNPWSMNMLFLWDNYMRGTKLAEDGNILQLYVGGDLYSGYPFGFQRSKAAPNDFIVNFSFSFIVKDRLSNENLTVSLDDAAQNLSEYGLWGKML